MSVRRNIKQLAGESAIYGISGVIGRFVGIFLVPIYTRIFTPADYGIISLLSVFTNLVGMFAVLALDNSAARWFYDTEDYEDRRKSISSWFWCQLTTGSLLALSMWLMAPQISAWLTGSCEHALLVRLVALGIPVATGGKVFSSWLRYQRRAKLAVTFSLFQTLCGIGIIVLFVVLLRQGLAGLFTAKLISACIMAMIGVSYLRGWIAPTAFSLSRLRPMLRYAIPLIPAAISLWVMMGMDRIMLRQFSTITEVGLYATAASIASLLGLFTAAFTQAWGPFAYSILKDEESRDVYAYVLDLYSLLGCLACTALAIFAPLTLRIMTTEAYYPAASTVGLLAFGVLLNGVRFIGSLGCGVVKKSVPAAISVGIGAGLNLILNILLIPLIGRNGAALATMIAWAGSAAYLFRASQRLYPIPFRWTHAIAPIVLAWILIGIDNFLIDGDGMLENLLRAALLLPFIPMGLVLRKRISKINIIKLRHIGSEMQTM